MERRAFLQLLGGLGVSSIVTSAAALEIIAPPPVAPDPGETPTPAVATPDDMEDVKVEKAYYGHYRRVGRRHYRRVGRRHYRRVSRRVYRRHYYYNNPYYHPYY